MKPINDARDQVENVKSEREREIVLKTGRRKCVGFEIQTWDERAGQSIWEDLQQLT